MSILNQIESKILKNKLNISVIGLGYVGLPVALFFSNKFKVTGFDKSRDRISALRKKTDNNSSFSTQQLKDCNIFFTSNYKDISKSDIFIITTPTPINKKKQPDLKFIFQALNFIIQVGIKNKIIILESTVFPGASENIFIKYLENKTKFIVNKDL